MSDLQSTGVSEEKTPLPGNSSKTLIFRQIFSVLFPSGKRKPARNRQLIASDNADTTKSESGFGQSSGDRGNSGGVAPGR
jgi:hypothetical protein